MAEPKKPYYVSFAADRIPTSVDHSKSNPGPTSGSVRAGYTSMTVDAKLTIAWSDEPDPSGGPFFAQSVNVFFFLKDIKIAISSDYPKKSCPYKVTYEHELEDHVQPSIKLFYSFRDAFIKKINGISVPAQDSPQQLKPAEAAKLQQSIETSLVEAIKDTKAEITSKLEAHQRSVDTKAHYKKIYAKCPAGDWDV
jgi:hypothetical protein